ncbi:FkbM family methyltransferase [Candidatus Ruminimicrobium bovinum]|uniref:FkbM family methyltransferase n=1 Tax=Candidatus Ruminimicrobium bovinum TaxID=3242779 RepID=UPI0039B937B4
MLYKLKTKIRYSKFGNKIVNIILSSKYSDLIYVFFDKLKLTDTANLKPIVNKESYKFFELNKDRVKKIISYLADEKSKQIYSEIINYRCFINSRNVPEYSMADQYFPKDIIKLIDSEVFVDCGAYTGDTIEKFIKNTNGKYKKIIAFEADKKNFSKLQKKKRNNVFYFNLGIWYEKDILKFIQDETMSSKLQQTHVNINNLYNFQNITEQVIKIDVDAIDNIPECSDMTFLKMDIEGAELNALKGAEKTIRKNKPKLAICIYHSNEDMLEIPEWLINLNMNYKLYIRHHFTNLTETIIYAI